MKAVEELGPPSRAPSADTNGSGGESRKVGQIPNKTNYPPLVDANFPRSIPFADRLRLQQPSPQNRGQNVRIETQKAFMAARNPQFYLTSTKIKNNYR